MCPRVWSRRGVLPFSGLVREPGRRLSLRVRDTRSATPPSWRNRDERFPSSRLLAGAGAAESLSRFAALAGSEERETVAPGQENVVAVPNDLDELYDASYRRLVVQLYAICGEFADAEDAVQEAFVTALRKRREFTRVDNPEAWIRTVAVNRVRSGWKHAAVVRRYQVKVPGPQTDIDLGPDHVAIVDALSQLDRGQREVVVLHHLADVATAQIAAELGIPEGTVKSRLSRARARLADLLDDREEPRHV